MTDKPRIVSYIDKHILDMVDDYRYTTRIPSRSEAILFLIKIGLKHCGYAVEEEVEPPEKK